MNTVLICRAPHPRGEEDPRFASRVHGVRLQIVPFEARPTYRLVRDWDEVSDSCLAVRCHACRQFTEYQVVGSMSSARRTRRAPPNPAVQGAEA